MRPRALADISGYASTGSSADAYVEGVFNAEERAKLLEAEPDAAQFLRPYVGARKYLQGSERWILALQEASPTTLKSLPRVRERMAAVRLFRMKSKRKSTLAIADYRSVAPGGRRKLLRRGEALFFPLGWS